MAYQNNAKMLATAVARRILEMELDTDSILGLNRTFRDGLDKSEMFYMHSSLSDIFILAKYSSE